MTLTPGVHEVGAGEAEAAAVEGARAGARVFVLSCGGVSSKTDFFDLVVANFPLDPPLGGVMDGWDALSDSLWEGIYHLDPPVVVISWKGASEFKRAAPQEYAIATEVLRDLVETLARETYTVGRPKQVCVYLS